MIDLFTPSEKFRFDSKSYQQMGFYKVVENAPSNTECLEQLIDNHRTYFNVRIEEVKNYTLKN
jgi:hypothetical protein